MSFSFAFSDSMIQSDYNTDEYGNVYININVIGHVNNPGNYKILENTDLLTVLSLAGGPLAGSNLNKIKIYRINSPTLEYSLNSYLNNVDIIKFKPNDTILIKESIRSKILSNQSIINSILTFLNLYVTITKIN